MTAIQESNKQVTIVNFSIFNVEGFKTVAAKDSSIEKRVFSAINQMFKELKKRVEILEEDSPKYALMILTTTRYQMTIQQDTSFIKHDLENALDMTTEEFFARSGEIYAGNVDLFIKHAKEIDVAIDELISARIKSNSEGIGGKKMDDVIPYLFLLKAGFFGEKVYPLVMSGRSIRLLGGGDADKAVREACLRAVRSVKNFRLTDYLRAGTDRAREKIKARIECLDTYMDTVGEVEIVQMGSILTVPHTPKEAAARYATNMKITYPLDIENETGLMMYVTRLDDIAEQSDDSLA